MAFYLSFFALEKSVYFPECPRRPFHRDDLDPTPWPRLKVKMGGPTSQWTDLGLGVKLFKDCFSYRLLSVEVILAKHHRGPLLYSVDRLPRYLHHQT